ncbi:MAG: hypothetical protein AAGA55_03250 [Planctomycetota bacterium]
MTPRAFTEFSIYLQQRPGELAGVLEAAQLAGVEIHSVSTAEHLDRGCVRIIGTPEEALAEVCERLVEAGVGPVVESPVVGVEIDNRPGVVRDLALLMADSKINVRYCYLIPAIGGKGSALCVFRLDEHERAMQVIADADWPSNGTSGGEHAA